MKRTIQLMAGLSALPLATLADKPEKQPNILFIAVDDLNNWTGFLGGHPQVLTPSMDRLTKRGAAFLNAYCQTPACKPSRTSVRTDRYRYIVYADGSEELYDLEKDRNEWTNLAANPEMESVKASMEKWIPATCANPVPADDPIPGIETAEQWK